MSKDDVPHYTEDRADMVAYVPDGVHTLLDVGCATGSFACALRRDRRDVEVWGIDPTPHPGPDAPMFDRRITGRFPDDLPQGVTFDCAVFNDVLEHLVDPWSALAFTHTVLTGPKVVVASIPNARNAAEVIEPLVLRGRWQYGEYGVLDRSHLRFFTRSSICEMFQGSGFVVDRIDPIRVPTTGRRAQLNHLLRGRLTEFLAQRFAVVGRAE